MSTKSKIKQRDNYQCQLCGDIHGKRYETGVIVRVESHHIIPKSEGGLSMPSNLITLCDLCHDVLNPQRWKYQFGVEGTPKFMENIKKEFEKFIKLDPEERNKIKQVLWI